VSVVSIEIILMAESDLTEKFGYLSGKLALPYSCLVGRKSFRDRRITEIELGLLRFIGINYTYGTDHVAKERESLMSVLEEELQEIDQRLRNQGLNYPKEKLTNEFVEQSVLEYNRRCEESLQNPNFMGF
jgi:hypothetical protein